MSSGRKPTRNLDALHITHNPPGAQKEKIRNVPLSCEYDHIPYVHEQWGGSYVEEDEPQPKKRAGKKTVRPYAELRAASAFSFLDSASLPEDLIYQAAEKDLPAMAVVDTNGVYGAPRFYTAAKKSGVRALVGSELVLECHPENDRSASQRGGSLATHPPPARDDTRRSSAARDDTRRASAARDETTRLTV